MSKRTFLIIISGIILMSFIWIVLTPVFFSGNDVDAGTTAVHKGFQAPAFTLESPIGESFSLKNYKGQPIFFSGHPGAQFANALCPVFNQFIMIMPL